MRPGQPRLAPLPENEWNPEARGLLERLRPGGKGPVFHIFATLARHPDLLKRWLVFGTHVLVQSTLPAREREILILRIGWRCRSEYEWAQHRVIGREAGLTDAEIERIADGPAAPGWSALDATLLRAADELHDDACLSDATWRALAAHYDERQLLDLLFTVGQYTLVSMLLNSLGVPLDPGLQGFSKQPPAG
jgi:alkylhydroperoxidase family enzyme